MPISWKGTLAQYVGRLHRNHQAKSEVVVYDYVDPNVPVLARMAARRQVGYRGLGYTIEAIGDGVSGGLQEVGNRSRRRSSREAAVARARETERRRSRPKPANRITPTKPPLIKSHKSFGRPQRTGRHCPPQGPR